MGEYSRQPVKGLQFDLLDLAPEGKTLSGDLDCSEFDLSDLPRRTFTTPIHYELKLTPINGGHDLLVQGSLASQLTAVCDRCDEPFAWNLFIESVCHEYEDAFGTTVDLTDDLREDILVAIPQHFLCDEECRGLCPHCGQNLNQGTCDCEDSEAESDGSPIEEDNTADNNSPWGQLDQLHLS
ncbi:MAG: DUF177 domain-containing protein [Victivallales bacterium]|nr:DUF177 domain-containing protein [Victivallales bacterium]